MRFALLSVALMLSAPALANNEAATTAEAPQSVSAVADQPNEERKICKRFAASESRLGAKKICLTAEQWKRREQSEN